MVILVSTAPLVDRTSVQQYNRNGNTSEYCFISGQNISTTGMVVLVSTASLWTEHQYNSNGNSSKYCSMSGQNIWMTGMVILVNTASLVDRTYV